MLLQFMETYKYFGLVMISVLAVATVSALNFASAQGNMTGEGVKKLMSSLKATLGAEAEKSVQIVTFVCASNQQPSPETCRGPAVATLNLGQ
jgi:hypothetical protein